MFLHENNISYIDLMDLNLQVTHLVHRQMQKKNTTTKRLPDLYTKANNKLKYEKMVGRTRKMKIKNLEDKIKHLAMLGILRNIRIY